MAQAAITVHRASSKIIRWRFINYPLDRGRYAGVLTRSAVIAPASEPYGTCEHCQACHRAYPDLG